MSRPLQNSDFKLVIQAVICAPILGCALYVILSPRYQDKNWAYGIVGMILGHWMKPK